MSIDVKMKQGILRVVQAQMFENYLQPCFELTTIVPTSAYWLGQKGKNGNFINVPKKLLKIVICPKNTIASGLLQKFINIYIYFVTFFPTNFFIHSPKTFSFVTKIVLGENKEK